MNKVVTINLNGRAYQVEEDGYAKLKAYLAQATRKLADNPDKDEIVADFEQAIADKCDVYLKGGKTVVNTTQVESIISEMGPVGDDEEPAKAETAVTGSTGRRFYRIREGSLVAGVCNGIATYFNVDVTVIRLLTIFLIFVTHGGLLGLYILLAVFLPEARTPEEKAAARGERFSAEDLINSVRRPDPRALSTLGRIIRVAVHVVATAVVVVGIIALIGLLIFGMGGVWSLLISHNLYGISIDSAVPHWLAATVLACAFVIAATPLLLVTMLFYRIVRRSERRASVFPFILVIGAFAVATSIFAASVAGSPELRNAAVQYHNSWMQDHGPRCFFEDGTGFRYYGRQCPSDTPTPFDTPSPSIAPQATSL